jgi:hypothetical protein
MDGGSGGYAGAISGRTPKSDRLLESVDDTYDNARLQSKT